MKIVKTTVIAIICLFCGSVFAGGWDKDKGLDSVELEGELICLGCSLKKLSGANAQCGLYTLHDVGFKLADGTIWSFVNNAKGHDIIRAHHLVIHKKAKVTGWLYPSAHHIEIDSIDVDGVGADAIAKEAWAEDQKIAKALLARKVGKTPAYKSAKAGHGH